MLGGARTIIHMANMMSWREDKDDAKKPRQYLSGSRKKVLKKLLVA